MNEIINITKTTINEEEVNAVNARDLHREIGSKRQFGNWIKDRLAGFTEGQDYVINKNVKTGNGASGVQYQIDYIISLDVAKHIAMLERNEQGRKIRQYFIEVEKEFRRQASRQFPPEDVLMSTLYNEMERRIKAEAERDEYKRNLARIARASNLTFGEISTVTGLPKDIVVAAHCKSCRKPHKPQYPKYIQLVFPMLEVLEECRAIGRI